MAASRVRFRRRIGQLLLLALLVVPLRLSAHVHADRPTSSSTCPICTIATHWAAVAPPLRAAMAPLLSGVRVIRPSPDPVAHRTAPVRQGRAPPRSTLTHL
jgi:hypothetical protein